MPSGKNWIHFIYINLAFVLYITGVTFLSNIQKIKDNWPEYRCNPMYMPLSSNIEQDFVYCIQNMQTNYMGYLLQPLTFLTSSISGVLSSFVTEINSVRAMFDKIRNFISSIIQSVFGIFLNLVIEFQKITIGIKDLIGKTIGIMVTLMYMLDGSVQTMNSTWNGPPGQMVKSLGKCFHPSTKIKLIDDSIKEIQHVNCGDILEDGSLVIATMKIDNINKPEPLYLIKNQGINGDDILVTGTHYVFNKTRNIYVKVKRYRNAIIQTHAKSDWYSCLITDSHIIKIGNETFWDWEDFRLH
jgi:hypothetical protein